MISMSFNKDEDGDYSVIADGECIGFLCKRHNSGSGRALAGFVGATKPYDYLRWLPSDDRSKPRNFDKFLEAKKYIVGIYV